MGKKSKDEKKIEDDVEKEVRQLYEDAENNVEDVENEKGQLYPDDGVNAEDIEKEKRRLYGDNENHLQDLGNEKRQVYGDADAVSLAPTTHSQNTTFTTNSDATTLVPNSRRTSIAPSIAPTLVNPSRRPSATPSTTASLASEPRKSFLKPKRKEPREPPLGLDTIPEAIMSVDPDGLLESSSPEQLTAVSAMPEWLTKNLLAGMWTAIILWIIAVPVIAFAVMMSDDLKDDPYDYNCADFYIRDAAEPPDGQRWTVPDHGKYHKDCRLLYSWAQILIVAGSFTLFRPLVCILPTEEPMRFTIRRRPKGFFDSSSRVYMVQTIFSLIPAVLYLVCAIILGTSKFMIGPPTDSSYRPMFAACLALVCVSFIVSAHQALATGVASVHMRGSKLSNRTVNARYSTPY